MAAHEMADLLVITGVSCTQSGRSLIESLTDHGYAHVVAHQPPRPDRLVVLASHTATLWPVALDVARWPHRAPGAVVMLNGLRLGLVGLHAPSAQPRRATAPADFRAAVTGALARPDEVFPDMPVVVAGELAVNGGEQQRFEDLFHTAGLTDAYRHVHGAPPAACSDPQADGPPSVGRALVSAADASHIVACAYDQKPVADGLSDRPALSLLLRLPHRADGPERASSAGRLPSPAAGRPAAPTTSALPARPHLATPGTEER